MSLQDSTWNDKMAHRATAQVTETATATSIEPPHHSPGAETHQGPKPNQAYSTTMSPEELKAATTNAKNRKNNKKKAAKRRRNAAVYHASIAAVESMAAGKPVKVIRSTAVQQNALSMFGNNKVVAETSSEKTAASPSTPDPIGPPDSSFVVPHSRTEASSTIGPFSSSANTISTKSGTELPSSSKIKLGLTDLEVRTPDFDLPTTLAIETISDATNNDFDTSSNDTTLVGTDGSSNQLESSVDETAGEESHNEEGISRAEYLSEAGEDETTQDEVNSTPGCKECAHLVGKVVEALDCFDKAKREVEGLNKIVTHNEHVIEGLQAEMNSELKSHKEAIIAATDKSAEYLRDSLSYIRQFNALATKHLAQSTELEEEKSRSLELANRVKAMEEDLPSRTVLRNALLENSQHLQKCEEELKAEKSKTETLAENNIKFALSVQQAIMLQQQVDGLNEKLEKNKTEMKSDKEKYAALNKSMETMRKNASESSSLQKQVDELTLSLEMVQEKLKLEKDEKEAIALKNKIMKDNTEKAWKLQQKVDEQAEALETRSAELEKEKPSRTAIGKLAASSEAKRITRSFRALGIITVFVTLAAIFAESYIIPATIFKVDAPASIIDTVRQDISIIETHCAWEAPTVTKLILPTQTSIKDTCTAIPAEFWATIEKSIAANLTSQVANENDSGRPSDTVTCPLRTPYSPNNPKGPSLKKVAIVVGVPLVVITVAAISFGWL
ncbi:hypothetical protein VTL71DRAFT_3725 [Oculimacula yallundae]|uniref:Uncharacterized protein n=1 Tax=Oculimacula yallundae TaxID=86028 RepID=A0ABR4C3R4_9HELO